MSPKLILFYSPLAPGLTLPEIRRNVFKLRVLYIDKSLTRYNVRNTFNSG